MVYRKEEQCPVLFSNSHLSLGKNLLAEQILDLVEQIFTLTSQGGGFGPALLIKKNNKLYCPVCDIASALEYLPNQ